MQLTFRRVAGRFVLAAGVCAAVILVIRGDEPTKGVTYVVDPRPLGDALRHLDVTITVGDDVTAQLYADQDRGQHLQPLRLVTPTPSGEVTVTLDVLTADGAHRIVHRARPMNGATVEIVIGRSGDD